MRCTRNC